MWLNILCVGLVIVVVFAIAGACVVSVIKAYGESKRAMNLNGFEIWKRQQEFTMEHAPKPGVQTPQPQPGIRNPLSRGRVGRPVRYRDDIGESIEMGEGDA